MAEVVAVVSPTESGAISADGKIGYALVNYSVDTPDVGIAGADALIETGAAAEAAGIDVALGGDVIAGNPEQHPPTSELIGMVWGLGLTGITVSSAFFDLSSTAPTLATMIGLAVGIDYALFIVTRHRQGLSEGLSVEEAAARANGTAGFAVVFAAIAIAIADVSLTGTTATNIDVSKALTDARPIFMLLVIGLTVLPLTVVFDRIIPNVDIEGEELLHELDARNLEAELEKMLERQPVEAVAASTHPFPVTRRGVASSRRTRSGGTCHGPSRGSRRLHP